VVGVPDGFLDLPFFSFILGNVHVRGSATGSPTKIKEMFELAVKTNAKPWIQKRHMEKTNEVISDMEAGKAE
jgi:D-arabinose 1-dehydrogenase-like Zn-dependent alcohol dehydrogenase